MTDDPRALPEGGPAADQGADVPVEVPAAETPSPEPLSAEDATRLREDRDRYYDLLLRKTAEFDNYRKRTERERRAQAEHAAADLLLDLLPIVDDLERALAAESAGEHAEHYRKGVELIHRQILDLLNRRSVRRIEALGTDFDPNLHQAVSYDPCEGHRDGEIVAELRPGYLIGERLLRPSMVKVARG
ncbi:MAG: nucleotide exchange factor GrpE [Acidobacteriota bacterium]